MEHFLKWIALSRHWYINPNQKSNKYTSSLLSLLMKALKEHFLQGNVPLWHLLNAKPPFMSWWRSAFNKVNDWALNFFWKKILTVLKMLISEWTSYLIVHLIWKILRADHLKRVFVFFQRKTWKISKNIF